MKTPPRTTQRWALSRLPPPGEGTSPLSGLPNGKGWGSRRAPGVIAGHGTGPVCPQRRPRDSL